jgi:hypothetical protein
MQSKRADLRVRSFFLSTEFAHGLAIIGADTVQSVNNNRGGSMEDGNMSAAQPKWKELSIGGRRFRVDARR